jgi:RNA polymerase sigma factor (sigma-70 family)
MLIPAITTAADAYKPMPRAELNRLFSTARTGKTLRQRRAAVEQIFLANVRLALSAVGRRAHLCNHVYTPDDMTASALHGLWRAILRYKPNRKTRFSTYATISILNGIRRDMDVAAHSGIHIPVYLRDRERRANYARNRLVAQTGRRPTTAQVARACGLPDAEVAAATNTPAVVLSLDEQIGEKNNTTIGEMTPDPDAHDFAANSPANRAEVLALLQTNLNPRMAQIVIWSFGLDGDSLPPHEIAKRMGVTPQNIRAVLSQALQRLRHPRIATHLKDLITN